MLSGHSRITSRSTRKQGKRNNNNNNNNNNNKENNKKHSNNNRRIELRSHPPNKTFEYANSKLTKCLLALNP